MGPSKRPAGDMAIAGNLVVADGALMRGNLRCEGHARLGAGATIEGDVTVDGTVAARADARITGALVCGESIEWHPSASAGRLRCEGPLCVEGTQVAAAVDAREGIGPLREVSA